MTPGKQWTVASLVVFGVVLAYVAFLLYVLPEWAARGAFGSSFGGLAALFSGLALVGVIVALSMQSQELQLQRQELALNRKELSRAAAAQEATLEALRHQSEWLAMSILVAQRRAGAQKSNEEGLSETEWRTSLAAEFAQAELGRLGIKEVCASMARWKAGEIAEDELAAALQAYQISPSGDSAVDRQKVVDHIGSVLEWSLERAVDLREKRITMEDLKVESEREETPANPAAGPRPTPPGQARHPEVAGCEPASSQPRRSRGRVTVPGTSRAAQVARVR